MSLITYLSKFQKKNDKRKGKSTIGNNTRMGKLVLRSSFSAYFSNENWKIINDRAAIVRDGI